MITVNLISCDYRAGWIIDSEIIEELTRDTDPRLSVVNVPAGLTPQAVAYYASKVAIITRGDGPHTIDYADLVPARTVMI